MVAMVAKQTKILEIHQKSMLLNKMQTFNN